MGGLTAKTDDRPGTPDTSALFATSPVAATNRSWPVVVVGLPRSGSSLLSSVISQLDDWYVFDDLYMYREARGMDASGPLTPDQLERLIHFLGWQIRARIQVKQFAPPRMALADVDRMDDALRATFAGRPVHWHELQEEWLTRLARHHGRDRWGYKAPQDFMHLDLLDRLYPDVRFIYVVRDPRAMMASLKFVRPEDGHPAQYHPIAYSLYWRLADRVMARAAAAWPDRVLEVSFERLIADPPGESQRIAAFLGTTMRGRVELPRPNTSFESRRRLMLTPTESWICERIARRAMRRHGYEPGEGRFRLRDLPGLTIVTFRFVLHQLHRLVIKRSSRVSVGAFFRTLAGRAAP